MKGFAVLSLVFLAFIPMFLASTVLEEEPNAVPSRERRAPCPFIRFPCAQMPAVCTNMKNAISMGRPSKLHRLTDPKKIARNRYASGCPRKLPKVLGKNCDEYPFASTYEGGAGARIMNVPVRENSRQGGLLNAFYRKFTIGDGDCYEVKFG